MPPLKSSAAFHQQRRGLDRAQAELGHKQKIRSESGSPEAIRMRMLDEKLQSKHVQRRNVRLADDSNDKVAHRAGPVELIHRHVLPVALTQRRFPKPSGGNSSCDEDSNDSPSPRQSESRERPLGIQPSAETPACSDLASPAECLNQNFPSVSTHQVPPSLLPFHLSSTRPNASLQKTFRVPEIKSQRLSTQKHKKAKANAPKVKKLKYHQYVPPDKKGEAGPLPDLDSSHARILQQQQLFLQLQILSQQHHCHAPPPATDRDPPPSSSPSDLTSASSSPRVHIGPSSGTKVPSLCPNLDEMKVAELKCELKLRRLPVSGTRKDLIERLRTHQEPGRGGTASPTAGGTREPELGRTRPAPKTGGSFRASELFPLRLLRCDGPRLPNGATPVSFNSDPLGELMSSPASDPLTAPVSAAVKPERRRSGPAPCRFSLKSTSLPERGSVSSTAPAIAAETPPATVDKDRMLQEKDEQIAELTRMLLLNHRLVEELRMQLGNGNRDAPEAHVLKRVKEEPPDRSTSPPLVVLRGKEVITIKEETVEEEIASSSPTQQPHSQMHPELQQEQVCLQDSARQLAQQQAISRLLLMQRNTNKPQHAAQSVNEEAHQKPRPQKQRRSQKRHLQTQPPPQSEQRRSQLEKTRPERQVLLREQESVAKKHQQQSNKLQPVQMQSRMHPQQQQQHSDLLNNGSRPAVVGDSKRKPILIPLTNHMTGDRGKASNHDVSQSFKDTASLKNRNEERQKCVELQEAAAPRLQSPQTWKNSPSPFCQTEMFPGLDVLLSPLSSDSVETAASPSHDKLRDEDFIDLILQAGETPDALKDGRGFPFSSPCPSPLHLLPSPPNSPSSAALRHDSPLQPWTPAKSWDYKQHFDLCGGGCLEDFLEGVPGKPLHGAEPGGLLTLLDDQMMCSTCTLDPAPGDSSDRDRSADSKAWLGFPVGGESEWETSTLVPQTPPSVFSADFLDGSDLHMDWDS